MMSVLLLHPFTDEETESETLSVLLNIIFKSLPFNQLESYEKEMRKFYGKSNKFKAHQSPPEERNETAYHTWVGWGGIGCHTRCRHMRGSLASWVIQSSHGLTLLAAKHFPDLVMVWFLKPDLTFE